MTKINFHKNFFRLFFTIALIFLNHLANASTLLDEFAQVREQGVRTHVFDIENDSLQLNRDDGLYTSGLRYAYLYRLSDAEKMTVFGWRIGQELYTASNINLEPDEISKNDHPYAGWLYAGIFKEQHRTDGSFYRVGLDIGCLGSCAGGEPTQKALHSILDQPQPQAWSTQLGNEVGAVLYGEYAPVRWKLGEHVDIRPSVSGRFGNIFTDATASLMLRAGRLNLLPYQPTFHAFLRLSGRAVGYNATLQGGYFSNEEQRTVTPNGFVPEAEAGVVWNKDPFNILLSLVRRANEIKDLPDSIGMQNYVRISISYTP